jgi:hypothetical protein
VSTCKEEHLAVELVIDEMSEGIDINAGVTTDSCDWNSGSEKEMGGIEPV